MGSERNDHLESGMRLLRERRPVEAFGEFLRAIAIDPDDPRLWVNMGVARWMSGDHDAAMTCYQAALDIDPECAEAIENLAVIHRTTGQIDEAIAGFTRAIHLRPNTPRILVNLAGALESAGRHQDAIDAFDRALDIDPGHREARIGRGLNRLTLGDMGGMADLDHRLDRPEHLQVKVPGVPRWDGSDLGGKTLLVNAYGEGFGDAIMGIRSAAAARERCGWLVVACPDPLIRLMRRVEGVDEVVTHPDDLAPFIDDIAAQCPPLGLPWYLGLDRVEDIPASRRYLSAEPDDIHRWRCNFDTFGMRVHGIRRFDVGVVWQGRPADANDARRSFRLEHLQPLADVSGVSLWSLQKGVGSNQMSGRSFRIANLNTITVYRDGDLLETAAAIEALDLIITCDTGIAHLAGALGKPVWIALPSIAEWRWLRDRDDSPWYPTARLFRQDTPGDWPGVFRRMADALRQSTFPVS